MEPDKQENVKLHLVPACRGAERRNGLSRARPSLQNLLCVGSRDHRRKDPKD